MGKKLRGKKHNNDKKKGLVFITSKKYISDFWMKQDTSSKAGENNLQGTDKNGIKTDGTDKSHVNDTHK